MFGHFQSGYRMDRGYLVFARLYHLALVGAFFPTRTKPNT